MVCMAWRWIYAHRIESFPLFPFLSYPFWLFVYGHIQTYSLKIYEIRKKYGR